MQVKSTPSANMMNSVQKVFKNNILSKEDGKELIL